MKQTRKEIQIKYKKKARTTKHLKKNEKTKRQNRVRKKYTHTHLLSPVWHCGPPGGSEGGALSALL